MEGCHPSHRHQHAAAPNFTATPAPFTARTVFGTERFTDDECATVNKRLDDVEQEDISYRAGIGGTRLAYIEGWRVIKIANDIFGFNGWSTTIVNVTTEFIDTDGGKITAGVSCLVRVTLKNGAFHEDIGFGSAENFRNKAGALEKAKKEAVTDATKRALRYFGYALGLSTYDKEYLNDLGKVHHQNGPPAPATTAAALQPPANKYNYNPATFHQPRVMEMEGRMEQSLQDQCTSYGHPSEVYVQPQQIFQPMFKQQPHQHQHQHQHQHDPNPNGHPHQATRRTDGPPLPQNKNKLF